MVDRFRKTLTPEVRERLAVPEGRLPEVNRRLLEYPGVEEAMVLSTCNRVEVYAAGEEPGLAWANARRLERAVCSAADIDPGSVRRLAWTGPALREAMAGRLRRGAAA